MANSIFKTRNGDILDGIVFGFYGRLDSRIVESVLEANQGLADLGAILPAGIIITLPEAPAPQVKPRLSLFS